jgi:hypothetical protein
MQTVRCGVVRLMEDAAGIGRRDGWEHQNQVAAERVFEVPGDVHVELAHFPPHSNVELPACALVDVRS